MKKILSITIAFMLIFSCFAVTVFAEDFDLLNAKTPIGTFSDRYEKFYAEGEQYTRIKASVIETDLNYNWIVEEEYVSEYYLGVGIYIELTNQQKQEIKTVKLKTNKDRTLIEATFTYFDDAQMTVMYLKDAYLDEYNKVVTGQTETLTIEFVYPSYNNVEAQRQQLVGEMTTFTNSRLVDLEDDYDVVAKNSDGSMSVVVGKLLVIADEYYYLNYKEAGFGEDDWYSGSIGEIANKPLHKITDTQLIAAIDGAMEEYYNDDYGVLYDDDVTESISIGFFVFVFAVVPLAILVFFLIKAIRGKGIYKKLYFAVVAVCLAEIVVFAVLAGIVIKTSSDDNYNIIGGSHNDDQIIVSDWGNVSTEEIKEYADDIGVGKNGEEVELLKEAVYCGDGDCRDGCTTGYFYRDKDCSIEDAMLQLELGEKTDNMYDHIDNAVIYQASWSENIVVNSTEYENGYIVEYQVVGVG